MSVPCIGLVEVLLLTLVCAMVPLTGALIALLVVWNRRKNNTSE